MREFDLDHIGTVRINKSPTAKRMTLRVKENIPYVTIPRYSSYKAALQFVASKREWIEQNRQETQTFEVEDGVIFLDKQLRFHSYSGNRITTKELETEILINLPEETDANSSESQTKLKSGLKKILKNRAQRDFPPLLEQLAAEHSFEYKQLVIADLKSRWGSCDSTKKIKLSMYLAQLPYTLIEYVMLHELTHTEHMDHSAAFKKRLESELPDFRERKKQLKEYNNGLILL